MPPENSCFESDTTFCLKHKTHGILIPWHGILKMIKSSVSELNFTEIAYPNVSYQYEFEIIHISNSTPISLQFGVFEYLTEDLLFYTNKGFTGLHFKIGGYNKHRYVLFNSTVALGSHIRSSGKFQLRQMVGVPNNSTHDLYMPAYDQLAFAKTQKNYNSSFTHGIGFIGYNLNKSISWNNTIRIKGNITIENDPVFYNFINTPSEYPSDNSDNKINLNSSSNEDSAEFLYLMVSISAIMANTVGRKMNKKRNSQLY